MTAAMVNAAVWFGVAVGQQDVPTPPTAATATHTVNILSALPRDTRFAVMAPRLGALDDRWGALFGRMGWSGKPLTALQSALEIFTGLDVEGGAAVAVLSDRDDSDSFMAPQIVLLLPVRNQSAMLAFLAPQPLGEGYAHVLLRGRDTVVGTKGTFAVFGSTREAVRRVVESEHGLDLGLSPDQRRSYADSDAAIWLGSDARDFIEQLTGSDGTGAIMRSAIAALGRTRGVLVPMRVRSNGLVLEVCTPRTPNDDHDGLKDRANAVSLVGLLDEPLVLAYGGFADPTGRHARRWINPLFFAGDSWGVLTPIGLMNLINALAPVSDNVRQLAGSLALLPADDAGHDVRIVATQIIRTRDDARHWPVALRRVVQVLHEGPWLDPSYERVMTGLSYHAGAERIDGLNVDHAVLDLSGLENLSRDRIRRLFGEEGILLRIALVDPQTVVLTLGGGSDRFQQVVSAVRSDRSPLMENPLMLASFEQLSGTPSFALFGSTRRRAILMRLIDEAVGLDHTGAEPLRNIQNDRPWAFGVNRPSPLEIRLELFLPTTALIDLSERFFANP